MGGCFGLFLQAQKEDTYFTELAERAEYGNYETPRKRGAGQLDEGLVLCLQQRPLSKDGLWNLNRPDLIYIYIYIYAYV